MKINKIKGTNDFYGESLNRFNKVEKACVNASLAYGFKQVITPVMEYTEVFKRGEGDSSDMVNKEMYTFLDRSEKSLTLRPEGTAGVTRFFVESKLYAEPGLKKLFYILPMFRCERPQAGRYRQFYQYGVEAFGEASFSLDAEVIGLGARILNDLGIKNYHVEVNSIGSASSRARYNQALKAYFEPKIDCMCDDCKARLVKNPLRILDCKVDKNNPVLINAPKIADYLSEEDSLYFKNVLKCLDNLGVNYKVNPNLVRGLDYYDQDVFEYIYDEENHPLFGIALGGGGRYNGLAEYFGAPSTEAVGFGLGIERLAELVSLEEEKGVDVCVINIGDNLKMEALSLANHLRDLGLVVELDYKNSNLKPQFKLSDRVNPRFILIFGEEEVEKGLIQVKNKIENIDELVKVAELNKYLKIEGDEYAYKK